MSENLEVANGDKDEKYCTLLPQLAALIEAESDAIACMANVSAAIMATFGHWWVGFYRVIGDELVLGPFQGPLACTRIRHGRGVCGTAWQRGKTVIVDDVELFPGHIACSSMSRSEIVVPVLIGDNVVAVLDIDSRELAAFDDVDAFYLEQVAAMIAQRIHNNNQTL